MDFAAMIDPKMLIVVAACWLVGFILKQTPKVPNWSIIFIVTAFAIGFALVIMGVNAQAILQGILCGAVAVYGNQILKQAKEGVGTDAVKEFDQY